MNVPQRVVTLTSGKYRLMIHRLLQWRNKLPAQSFNNNFAMGGCAYILVRDHRCLRIFNLYSRFR